MISVVSLGILTFCSLVSPLVSFAVTRILLSSSINFHQGAGWSKALFFGQHLLGLCFDCTRRLEKGKSGVDESLESSKEIVDYQIFDIPLTYNKY